MTSATADQPTTPQSVEITHIDALDPTSKQVRARYETAVKAFPTAGTRDDALVLAGVSVFIKEHNAQPLTRHALVSGTIVGVAAVAFFLIGRFIFGGAAHVTLAWSLLLAGAFWAATTVIPLTRALLIAIRTEKVKYEVYGGKDNYHRRASRDYDEALRILYSDVEHPWVALPTGAATVQKIDLAKPDDLAAYRNAIGAVRNRIETREDAATILGGIKAFEAKTKDDKRSMNRLMLWVCVGWTVAYIAVGIVTEALVIRSVATGLGLIVLTLVSMLEARLARRRNVVDEETLVRDDYRDQWRAVADRIQLFGNQSAPIS